jgi:hypothetical protein
MRLGLKRIALICGLLLSGAFASPLLANADIDPTRTPDAATILHNDPRIVTGRSYEASTAYYVRIPDGSGADEKSLGVNPIAHAVTISGKRFIEIVFNEDCGSGGCSAQSLYYLDKPTFVAVRRINLDPPDRVENGWLITQLGAFRHPNWDFSRMSMAAMREDYRRQDVGFGYFNNQFMRRWNWKVVAIQPEPRGATVQVMSVDDHLVHARVDACVSVAQLDDVVVESGAPSQGDRKKFSFVLDHVDSLKAGMWVRMIGGLRGDADPRHDAPTFPRIVRLATQRERAAAQLGICQGG